MDKKTTQGRTYQITEDKVIDLLMHTATREEVNTTRTELKQEIQDVRNEIKDVRNELKSDISQLNNRITTLIVLVIGAILAPLILTLF